MNYNTSQNNKAIKNTKSFKLDEFEQLLKNHDWYYSYNDNYSIWHKGKNSAEKIRFKLKELKKEGLGEEAKKLFDKYNPHNN